MKSHCQMQREKKIGEMLHVVKLSVVAVLMQTQFFSGQMVEVTFVSSKAHLLTFVRL